MYRSILYPSCKGRWVRSLYEQSQIRGDERIVFTASEKKARFVSFKDDFYKNLEEKLIASAPFAAHRH